MLFVFAIRKKQEIETKQTVKDTKRVTIFFTHISSMTPYGDVVCVLVFLQHVQNIQELIVSLERPIFRVQKVIPTTTRKLDLGKVG